MVARPPLPTNYNLRGPQIKRTVSPTDRFFIVHKGHKGHKYFYNARRGEKDEDDDDSRMVSGTMDNAFLLQFDIHNDRIVVGVAVE